MGVLAFIINVLLVYGLLGLAGTSVLFRFRKGSDVGAVELLLYGLGLGPALMAVLLYYLLLLLPEQSPLLYVGIVVSIGAAVMLINRQAVVEVMGAWKSVLKKAARALAEPFGAQEGNLRSDIWHYFSGDRLFFLFVLFLLFYTSGLAFFKPITDHDALIYVAQGKVFFDDLAINYGPERFHEANSYYYIGQHAFTYPLQLTWERMINQVIGVESDIFFRHISLFYFVLMLALPYYWLRKVNARLGFLAVVLLFTAGVNWNSLMYQNLDTFRIFLFAVMVIFMLRLVRKVNKLHVLGFGLFAGLAAGVHSIGMMLAAMAGLVLVLFMRGNFVRERLPAWGMAAVLIVLFGGLHYLLDLTIGTGWFLNATFY